MLHKVSEVLGGDRSELGRLGGHVLDDGARGHAVADAHGLQAVAQPSALKVVDELGHEDGARGTEGVTKSLSTSLEEVRRAWGGEEWKEMEADRWG